MKPFGIEKQTLLVALLPILMMAMLLESYLVHSRFSDLDGALLERSQLLARQLASSSEYAVFSNNTDLLRQNINSALSHQDVSGVVVLDASANPLMDGANQGWKPYGKLPAMADSSSRLYQDRDMLVLYEPIAATQIRLDPLDIESGLRPAAAPNQPIGTVILEISKQRLNGKKHEILLYSLAITAAILSAALMLALWAARAITRPVKEMSEAIHSFGTGKLETRIQQQPQVAELHELTNGFNKMAQQIQHHQEILEKAVAERTAELATSEHELRTLIENTPDTISRYDRNLRRIYVNPAFGAMVGGGKEILLGKTPSEFPGGQGAEIYEARIRAVFESGEDANYELVWQGKDGRKICSNIRLTAERDDSGAITSVLAVGRDITELNESRDELQRKEQAKSHFLAAAGHDLRQPLAAANLFIDALKFTGLTPEGDKIIHRLDQAMSTFNELLEALLNISKLDAGSIKPEYTLINVIEIFEWLEQNYAVMAQQKHLGFRLHFPAKELLVIRSDLNLLKSVLMNLVSNAIKYTSEGAVLVSARRCGNDVLFQVWDTGIGIKDEHLEHIFDEFYQVNNPQRDRSMGLGLGLAIGKRAISLLGGKISCRSRIGHGSVFEFRLPLNATAEVVSHASGIAPESAALMSYVQGKRFVVVEDDVLVAEAICGTLTMLGGESTCFHSAEAAMQAPATERADCYIADYTTGGTLNGIQFLNRLREELGRPIVAVLMTGDTSPAFIRAAENCDWPVLHKPVNISKLIAGLSSQGG